MAEQFRWILLVFGLLLLVGIWWWGNRRSTQAPGNAELRESSVTFKEPEFVHEPRERSAPGFEPVSLHPSEFDRIPVMHEPIMVDIEPTQLRGEPRLEPEPAEPPTLGAADLAPSPVADTAPGRVAAESRPPAAAQPVPAAEPVAVPVAAPPQTPVSDPATSAAPPALGSAGETGAFSTGSIASPNTAEKQKIISIRVCTTGTMRWQGNALLAAFELNGLAYGRYQVFHRRHVDGRSLFCVASMTEPGVFDVAKMQNQEFRGVTLFAVLPGPLEALLTVDELLLAARDLAIALNGAVQDAQGAPMTAQRAATLRDEVAQFQAALAAG